jgi:hypothetical protein
MLLRGVLLRVVADNKKPQPELGLVGDSNEATLAEDGETTSDVSKVSLFCG